MIFLKLKPNRGKFQQKLKKPEEKTINGFMGLDSCLFKSLGHTTLVTLLTISNSGPLALALIMTSNTTTTTTTNNNNNYTRNLLLGSSVAHRKKFFHSLILYQIGLFRRTWRGEG
jgi:hypothetical protein